ncbi:MULTISPECIES: hypothetical protein [unclassified Streptomyces]|nr:MULTISPECIES: hypothetical protein [unclassified Streptomyces]
MSTRAVLLAALVTGLLLGVVGARTQTSGPSDRGGSIVEPGR